MFETILYYLLWQWVSIKTRIKLENAWYWLIDEPMWEPPDYKRLVRTRSRIPVIPPARWD